MEIINQEHNGGVLDIQPRKNLLLFDRFGFTGFKKFVINNDMDLIDKVFYNVNRFNKKENKINLISLKFCRY